MSGWGFATTAALNDKASLSDVRDAGYVKYANGKLQVCSGLSCSDISIAGGSHTHDDRYYTESEINTKLAGKADSGHTHSQYAAASHIHATVEGTYSGNGGAKNPNAYGKNRVGFFMSSQAVNGNSQYKDWILLDCYHGNDVGGAVAIGVNRQSLGAYIMRSEAARTAWAASAELIGTHNYASILDGRYVTLSTPQSITALKTLTAGLMVSGRAVGGGDDEGIVIGRASNNYAGLILGGTSGVRSVLYLTSGNESLWRHNDGTTSWDIRHPMKSGIVALTRDLSNYLPAASYTAADVLAKLKTVDGSGSGLDADTVDGLHNGSLTASLINYNNAGGVSGQVQFMQKSSGWNAWDAPSQNWFSTMKLCHGNGDTYYSRVLAFEFFTHRIHTHYKSNNNNGGWKTIAFLDDTVANASSLGGIPATNYITADDLVQLHNGQNIHNKGLGFVTTTTAQTVAGSKTFSAVINANAGVRIGSTDDYGWYNNNSRITAGTQVARGVNVGSLLVSSLWADYTKVPTNGIYSKGNIITLGGISATSVKIELDANNSTANMGGEINRFGGALYLQHRGGGANPTGNLLMVCNGGKVGIGTASPTYKLDVADTAIFSSWIRTRGATGWYSETYGGGWYMTDSTWVRTYNGKSIYAGGGTIRTDGELQVGGSGDRFRVTSAGKATMTCAERDVLTISGSASTGAAINLNNNGKQGVFGMNANGLWFQNLYGANQPYIQLLNDGGFVLDKGTAGRFDILHDGNIYDYCPPINHPVHAPTFSGFGSGSAVKQQTAASTVSMVWFNVTTNRFVWRASAGNYYANGSGGDLYGEGTTTGRKPRTGAVFYCNNKLWVFNGTTLKDATGGSTPAAVSAL